MNEEPKLSFRPEPDEHGKNHHGYEDLIKPKVTSSLASRNWTSSMSSDNRIPEIARNHQRQTSTCVANGATRAAEIMRVWATYRAAIAEGASQNEAMQRGIDSHVKLSRLAVYYLSRELMSPPETDKDEGTYCSMAAEALRRFGVARENKRDEKDEAFWPFDEDLLFKSPSLRVMREAFAYKISKWFKIKPIGSESGPYSNHLAVTLVP